MFFGFSVFIKNESGFQVTEVFWFSNEGGIGIFGFAVLAIF